MSRPAIPRLFLEVKAKPELSLTLPYKVEFILRRAKRDGYDRPCVFRWSPTIDGFSASGIVLLGHADSGNPDGLETCEVDHPKPLKPPSQDSIAIDEQNGRLCELAPGGEAHCIATLPARYYQALQAGKMYTLLYTGGEVASWDWGTIEEHFGKEMKARRLMSPLGKTTNLPTLMIPGGARVSFTARTAGTPWPGRAEYEAWKRVRNGKYCRAAMAAGRGPEGYENHGGVCYSFWA